MKPRTLMIVYAIYIALWLAVVIGIGYAAVHFIIKYW